jgi:hypothetical protein
VSASTSGTWPDTWPSELDVYRDQTTTVEVAHGIQETVYEISFRSREEFEKAWPHILKVKDKGAPLILERSPSIYHVSGSNLDVGVRILTSCRGAASGADGKIMPTDGPWPEDIRSSAGVLPEYASVKDGKWVPTNREERRGFKFRARTDIMLVSDGKTIDLNRIPLPADTPIIDNRFKK